MNDLLRAYGRFDVAAGQFSVFSRYASKTANSTGMLNLCSLASNFTITRKTRTPCRASSQGAVNRWGLSSLQEFAPQQVATEVDLSRKLASPGVSTWQALGQIVHNAFIT